MLGAYLEENKKKMVLFSYFTQSAASNRGTFQKNISMKHFNEEVLFVCTFCLDFCQQIKETSLMF